MLVRKVVVEPIQYIVKSGGNSLTAVEKSLREDALARSYDSSADKRSPAGVKHAKREKVKGLGQLSSKDTNRRLT